MSKPITLDPVAADSGVYINDAGAIVWEYPLMYETRNLHVHGWTWDDFMTLVAYESMFIGALARKDLTDTKHLASAMYEGIRVTRGYNGHIIHTNTTIFLHDANGVVPPYDPDDTEVRGS